MWRRRLFTLILLLLVGPGALADRPDRAADEMQRTRPNTWSATTSTGRTLSGTWTWAADAKTGAVTGTWTLLNAQGRTVARGGWSAVKSPAGWTGNWRATVSGSAAEYSGSWRAEVDLATDAGLADLFKRAIQSVVSGTWRAGRQSGAWSIRALN